MQRKEIQKYSERPGSMCLNHDKDSFEKYEFDFNNVTVESLNSLATMLAKNGYFDETEARFHPYYPWFGFSKQRNSFNLDYLKKIVELLGLDYSAHDPGKLVHIINTELAFELRKTNETNDNKVFKRQAMLKFRSFFPNDIEGQID